MSRFSESATNSRRFCRSGRRDSHTSQKDVTRARASRHSQIEQRDHVRLTRSCSAGQESVCHRTTETRLVELRNCSVQNPTAASRFRLSVCSAEALLRNSDVSVVLACAAISTYGLIDCQARPESTSACATSVPPVRMPGGTRSHGDHQRQCNDQFRGQRTQF
jgi:hypothetical protein